MKTQLLLTILNSGFRIVIGFLCLKLIAIFGKPENILQFGQVQSYLNIFTTVAQLGLGYGILTVFKEAQSNSEQFLSEKIAFFTIIGTLLFGINFLFPDFVSPPVRAITASVWFFIALMGSIYVALFHSYYVTSQRPSQANIFQITSYGTALVLISIITIYNIQLLGLAVGIANLLVAVAALLMIKGVNPLAISHWTIKKQVKNILRKNLQYIIYTLISVLVAQGTLIVSRDVFFNSSDTKNGAMIQLVFSMMFAINTIYTTYMSTYYFSGITTARGTFIVMKKICLSTLAIFMVIFFCLNILGDEITELLLSNQYKYKVELNIFIIAEFLKSFILPVVFFLIAHRYVSSLILAELIAFFGFIVTLKFLPVENSLIVIGSSFSIGALLSFIFLLFTFYQILKREMLT